MLKITIEPEERIQLEALARTTKDARTAIKIRVVLALSDGWSAKDIARIFLLDEDTITKWKQKYQNRNLFWDWLATVAPSYTSKLTRDQQREVERYVETETIRPLPLLHLQIINSSD